MPDQDVEVTELTVLDATKVSGVGSPANGTPWLLLKASGGSCSTCGGTGKIRDGHVTCPDCAASKAEADEIEEELTKAGAAGFCAQEACEACKSRFGPLHEILLAKAKLSAADRKNLDDSDFAYVDSKGGRHLPVHDGPKFESGDAKAKAAGKIAARAKEVGVDVDDGSDVAQAAKSSGVPAVSVTEPAEGGHLEGSGKSGLAGPVTDGLKPAPGDVSRTAGGESSYAIPDEARVATNPPRPEAVKTAVAVVGSLVEAIDRIAAARQAQKDGNWLSVDNPAGPAATSPGSGPWETYDSATLSQVATCLASCCAALDSIQQREAVEAASGNPGDYSDAYDLSCAADVLDAALGVVARLAYHEGAAAKHTEDGEDAAAKAGRRNSSKDLTALRAARDHLTNVIGDGADTKAGSAGTDSEGDDIMSAITKEDLVEAFTAGAATAAKEALEADRQARKQAKKDKAAKNANNGGDITAGDMKDKVGGTVDEDLSGVPNGGQVSPNYVNKAESKKDKALKAMADELKAATDVIGRLEEKVTKMAARPRSGGPVLDGVARGGHPAAEGRLTETAAKGAEDGEIERLAKTLDESKDPIVRSDVSQQLTLARLRKAHADGLI